MNLHEFRAKELLTEEPQQQQYIQPGIVVSSLEEIPNALNVLGGKSWILKAQVYAGGRGKAGGVRYVTSEEEVNEVAQSLLGKNLVTYQTDAHGQPVNSLLITQPCDIKEELYLSLIIDRGSKRLTVISSTEGGVDIETVARETPERILTTAINPLMGLQTYQSSNIGLSLGLPITLIKPFTEILSNLYEKFVKYDLSLIEINPLVIDKQDKLILLDAKITVDDNALYRQPKLKTFHDPSQEDARENHAHEWGLNYIALDGNIGCMVNGAGLAMATMDLIKLHGGNPANFLDVGGGATKERVMEAFKIILSDQNVKGILVNIFGGIVRCDMIAEGIIGAISEANVTVPVMVRLVGNNAEKGMKLLRDSGLNLMASEDLTTAAKQLIEAIN